MKNKAHNTFVVYRQEKIIEDFNKDFGREIFFHFNSKNVIKCTTGDIIVSINYFSHILFEIKTESDFNYLYLYNPINPLAYDVLTFFEIVLKSIKFDTHIIGVRLKDSCIIVENLVNKHLEEYRLRRFLEL